MKILHLLGSFRLPKDPDQESSSGVVRVALELAKLQVQQGHQVVLACVGREAWQTTWHGVTLRALKPLSWAHLRFLGRSINLSRHLPFVLLTWQQSFDVVHSHLYYYLRGLRAKIRLAHVHGDPLHQGMGDHKVGMSAADFALLERTANGFIAVSKFIAMRLQQGLSKASKVHVVYNGVNFERFTVTENERERLRQHWRHVWQAHQDATVYVYVGAVVPEKGVLQLAKAFATIESERDDVHLVIIGSSNLWGTSQQTRDPHVTYEATVRDVLAAATERGRAHLVGKVSPSQVAELLAASDVAVVPSIWQEPGALVILEAYAAGLPLIGSRVGGIPEIAVHGNHTLLPAGDEAALQASLAAAADGCLAYTPAQATEIMATNNQLAGGQDLTDDPSMTHKTAFQRLQDNFSWQRAANDIMNIYEQALHM
ncbi:MAG: glycosyltransferase family 4 protein [Deinococcota bacterium]